MEIGDKLKEYRKCRKMSIYKLSKFSKVSQSYISDLENGKNNKPSIDILSKLASALEVDITSFLGDYRPNFLTVTVDVRDLDNIKNTVKVINNKVFNQGKNFTPYDIELLDALLGKNWGDEYIIGQRYIEE
ncbi:helix-turn-helix domain-containing protein [Clostridium perfringens]|uniref:helix-turn-helix domain-containing protein n=1 Tax=Clostridium perfringens TaxID=1502 RepID=UPI001FB8D7D6|nr:helix-turn-helix transcriptional regulator [Clostridium perfringens]